MSWIVCEDGREYIDRFVRLFPRVSFAHAANAHEIVIGKDARGVILDLDFRRTPKAQLIGTDAREEGVWIARRIRAEHPALLIVLCADLVNRAEIESELAPCRVLSSEEMLGELAALFAG